MHEQKKNPIITSSYSQKKYYEFYQNILSPSIDYRFEIQKYESDEGYFFQNSKNYIAIVMYEISYDKF